MIEYYKKNPSAVPSPKSKSEEDLKKSSEDDSGSESSDTE